MKVERVENTKKEEHFSNLITALIEFYDVCRKHMNTNCWTAAKVSSLLSIVLNTNTFVLNNCTS